MPETFGRYQLLRRLAVGGMGEVFLARQVAAGGFEKLLVVKRVLPHLQDEEDFIEMLFDEARIAAALNHPNISQIYELGDVDGVHYIAMEYIHGDSLRGLHTRANAEAGGLPLALKCRVIADAAAGLDFAHRAKTATGKRLGLIHRDISPQNILISFNGAVKLIDFGVAKAVGKISNTHTGHIKGKYAYMSPEQARGEELDHRSDIFGLGIVFYELLTSTRLFKRQTDTLTLKAVVGAELIPPSELVKGLPKALDALVLRLLERDRSARYQTMGEFQLALEDLLVQERLAGTVAHLAAFLQRLYEAEISEDRFHSEPTQIAVSPFASTSGRALKGGTGSKSAPHPEKSGASGRKAARKPWGQKT